jgi:hypothetical protein
MCIAVSGAAKQRSGKAKRGANIEETAISRRSKTDVGPARKYVRPVSRDQGAPPSKGESENWIKALN